MNRFHYTGNLRKLQACGLYKVMTIQQQSEYGSGRTDRHGFFADTEGMSGSWDETEADFECMIDLFHRVDRHKSHSFLETLFINRADLFEENHTVL